MSKFDECDEKSYLRDSKLKELGIWKI
jgi:hypothetical protein